MSWAEARSRIGQETSKRLDSTFYRLGIWPQDARILSRPARPASCFLGSNRDQVAHRAALLRTHLPEEAENIIREADNICRHQFHLLGFEKLDYGPEIDWHFDPVHGKRSPLKPWFKIKFLDFQEVGDHKIIWELNRHQHLVTLAKAWTLTGNRAYTSELLHQWYSWHKANPYPLGINWASALEVAFRSMSWLWVRYLLAECPDLPATFDTDLLLALQAHGRYVERYLSTYFSPNTHLLGEALALFFIGTLCPEIAAAQRWRDKGWKILLEEPDRQVRPDGVYFEQALYYHVYALDFFLHARHLASETGCPVPQQFDNMLKKMLDVVQALSEAGSPEGFGDDDGGRLFNPRRNQVECMTDPLALGSILYDSNDYRAPSLTEEAIWLFGDKAFAAFEKPSPQRRMVSKAFESGGIYLINDNATCAQQMMIDAGPQGTSRSGHGHADALSIRLSVDGQRFLVDPGTYCYISPDNERDSFRGTGAHNTLRMDGLDQAIPEGPFAWSSIPNVKVETWVNGESFDFFAGNHDGYRRLPDPVLHRRIVFHVKGGFWFVRDVAEGLGSHLLESLWHFAPDIEVKEEEGMLLAMPRAADRPQQRAGLALLPDRNSKWKTEIAESFVSRAYGSKQRSPVVRVSVNVTLPEDCPVMLLPTTLPSDIGTFATVDETPVRGVRGYRYRTSRSSEFLFSAQGNIPWTCGPWTGDASFLYCKLESGRFTRVIMVAGSFAEWRGRRFVSNPSAIGSFEWSDSLLENHSPEDALLSDFEFLDLVP